MRAKVELTKQTEALKADVHYFSMGGKNRPNSDPYRLLVKCHASHRRKSSVKKSQRIQA